MKKWYTSRSIWLGVIAVAVAGLEAYKSGADPVTVALAVFGAVAIFLRTQTNKTLTK